MKIVVIDETGLIGFKLVALLCGMSIGYEDPTVSYARTARAPLGETLAFVGG